MVSWRYPNEYKQIKGTKWLYYYYFNILNSKVRNRAVQWSHVRIVEERQKLL